MSTVAAGMSASEGRARPVHTRTEVLGLLLIAGSVLFTTASGLITGIPFSDASFFIVPIVLAAVGAALAWRFATWGQVAGLVLGLAGGVMVFWLFFGIFVPASFVEFTTAVGFTIGVFLTIGGGVAAIRRRADLRVEATPGEQRIDRIALGAVALALVVSLPLWLAGRSTVSAEAAAGLPAIDATNFAYSGATTATAENGQVQVVVHNDDAFLHTFTIDSLGVNETILPGSTKVITFAADPGQSLTYYCEPHSSDKGNDPEDMAGTLAIE